MALEKKKIIEGFKIHEKDVGSSNVQIALLTQKIKHLAEHVKQHKKDKHTTRGLLGAVSQRKKLLSYLKRKDEAQYQSIIKELGLRK